MNDLLNLIIPRLEEIVQDISIVHCIHSFTLSPDDTKPVSGLDLNSLLSNLTLEGGAIPAYDEHLSYS